MREPEDFTDETARMMALSDWDLVYLLNMLDNQIPAKKISNINIQGD
jgi:hypothetical protein